MKFQPDTQDGVNVITRHERGRIWVGSAAFSDSLLVPWAAGVQPWPVRRFDELTAAHFESLLALRPELVIFGSGHRMRFAAPELMRALTENGIGVETMDTAAACRTFNVLAAEKRSVLAALLIDEGGSAAKTL